MDNIYRKTIIQITKLTNYIKMNLMRLKHNKENKILKLKGVK